MREIRLSGSEGGGTGNSTGPPYPYPTSTAGAVGAGHARDKKAGGCAPCTTHFLWDRDHPAAVATIVTPGRSWLTAPFARPSDGNLWRAERDLLEIHDFTLNIHLS